MEIASLPFLSTLIIKLATKAVMMTWCPFYLAVSDVLKLLGPLYPRSISSKGAIKLDPFSGILVSFNSV
jgi:hypothetical protein